MDDLVSGYDFDLPGELIAQRPAERRDGSRLLVLDNDGIAHRHFRDVIDLVRPGDVLVLNETRVIAARMVGHRPSGGRVEVLLLHPADSMRYDATATRWSALVRPAKRMRVGQRIEFAELGSATVTSEEDDGLRVLAFDLAVPFEVFLSRAGRLPLPPYIHNESDEAQERYQTVFARSPGSVAAPTASLHFTAELLERLERRGVEIIRLTLDVGLGTFRPMKSKRLDAHTMHAERYAISPEVSVAIAAAKRAGRRVIAAGTTVVRALEGNARAHGGSVVAGEFTTDIFIRPGFSFSIVDAMVTNFHLPRSTLLVLVSAFAGRELVRSGYAIAVENRYRFFSFGDAMWLNRQPS